MKIVWNISISYYWKWLEKQNYREKEALCESFDLFCFEITSPESIRKDAKAEENELHV